ncbi:putative membrane protein [Ekhidna lutea]|uniref:Protoporphyrinogen IX oxidase n=1 Tax=Ekhidna lutea TaxID=447679 RepID=A0A239KE97_EKHLU|nr:CopD family protein [Ekhidna lutea]SNT16375.1 putative membrane protein [Ekhidna lutea]
MDYLYLKALHIIFVITWFAGLFYIVRLFIYHTEAIEKPEPDRSILSTQLALMSKKLWYIITWPSAVITIALGTSLLVSQPSWLKMPFMHVKLGFVLLLILYHLGCHGIFRQLQKGKARYSSTQLRIFNEAATIILFAIVFLIVLKNELSWIWGTMGLISFAIVLMVAVKLYKNLRKK